jgi:hypothetical protein
MMHVQQGYPGFSWRKGIAVAGYMIYGIETRTVMRSHAAKMATVHWGSVDVSSTRTGTWAKSHT